MCSRAVKFILKKKLKKSHFDFYLHIWYCYHILFFGSLIFRGKKLKAFNFFLNLKKNLKMKENNDPFLIFLVSMLKITPKLLLRPTHFGSFTKGVPLPISEKKSISYAVKWTIKLLKDQHKFVKMANLVELLVLALYNKGDSLKKKEGIYKVAKENRHLIRYFK